MAAVAGTAGVTVAPLPLVFVIHRRLGMRMAGDAFKDPVVGRVHMAGGATGPSPLMLAGENWEKPVVIEGGISPAAGGVAELAFGRKAG